MVRLRVFYVLVGVLLGASFVQPALALDEKAADALVDKVVQDAMSSLAGKNLPPAERNKVVRRLIDTYADLQQTSADVLGRYWTRASDADRAKFKSLVIDYILAVWGQQLDDMTPDQKILVKSAEPQGDRVVVHSQSIEAGEEPTPVDWVVGSTADGRLIIVDVTVDNVSPVRTIKDDFTSFLRTNGGQLSALFVAMQKKIDMASAAK